MTRPTGRLLSLALALALILALIPFAGQTAKAVTRQLDASTGAIVIENATYTVGNNAPISYSAGDTLEITGSPAYVITVQGGANVKITLKDVSIDASLMDNTSAFEITGNSTVNLTLVGSNTLKSGSNKAGLQVESGNKLSITGTGSLNAVGGTDADDIGKGNGGTSGNVFAALPQGNLNVMTPAPNNVTFTATPASSGAVSATPASMGTVNILTGLPSGSATLSVIATTNVSFSLPGYNAVTRTAAALMTPSATVPFAKSVTYPLTVRAGTGGYVSGMTSGSYAPGAYINVTATSNANYMFTGWSCSSNISLSSTSASTVYFSMPSGSATLTANFQYIGPNNNYYSPFYAPYYIPPAVAQPAPSTPSTSSTASSRRGQGSVGTSSATVYSQPGRSAARLGTLRKYDGFNILGYEGEYWKIAWSNAAGYAYIPAGSANVSFDPLWTGTAVARANVSARMSTAKKNRLGTLEYGERVVVLARYKDWWVIVWGREAGFVKQNQIIINN